MTTDVSESESNAPATQAPAESAPRAAEGGRSEERPAGERPAGDRPAGDRPSGERSYGDRPDRPSGPRRGGGGGRGRFGKRKVCAFCVDKVEHIDYKESGRLRRYVSERGKIEPRRKTGTCARHQRKLTLAIKRARHIALLPYTSDHVFPSGG